MKKAGAEHRYDISATRLSCKDPIGFPSHPRGWFSIVVYQKYEAIGMLGLDFFIGCPSHAYKP